MQVDFSCLRLVVPAVKFFLCLEGTKYKLFQGTLKKS